MDHTAEIRSQKGEATSPRDGCHVLMRGIVQPDPAPFALSPLSGGFPTGKLGGACDACDMCDDAGSSGLQQPTFMLAHDPGCEAKVFLGANGHGFPGDDVTRHKRSISKTGGGDHIAEPASQVCTCPRQEQQGQSVLTNLKTGWKLSSGRC